MDCFQWPSLKQPHIGYQWPSMVVFSVNLKGVVCKIHLGVPSNLRAGTEERAVIKMFITLDMIQLLTQLLSLVPRYFPYHCLPVKFPNFLGCPWRSLSFDIVTSHSILPPRHKTPR